MLSADPISSHAPHGLYEVVVSDDGVHLTPTSLRGHECIKELMHELGLFDRTRGSQRQAAPLGNAGIVFYPDVTYPRTTQITRTPQTAPAGLSIAPPMMATAPAISAIGPRAQPIPAPVAPEPLPATDVEVMRLSDMAALHLGNMKRGKSGERSATKERKYILDLFQEVIGDQPIDSITVGHATTFVDLLAVWPAYVNGRAEFKHMSAVSIAAKSKIDKIRPIHASTQGKHVKALKAFFHWCVEAKAVKDDPFRFIQLARYRDLIPRKKDVFTTQDITTLFDPKRMDTVTEPHKFWVPLIAHYTGMRVNEVCQLYLEDIKRDTVVDETGTKQDLLYFSISPFREGQRVKTLHGVRHVPVHSKLIELGIETYIADVRRSGSDHLFPGLTWGIDGPGRVLTQWFNGNHLRKDCGITSHAKSLHCFRHTITTMADRALIPKSVMRTLNGHSDGAGLDDRAYVARANLVECKQALERLPFPAVDVAPYFMDRFRPYLDQARTASVHRERLVAEGKPAVTKKGRPPKLSQLQRPLGSSARIPSRTVAQMNQGEGAGTT